MTHLKFLLLLFFFFFFDHAFSDEFPLTLNVDCGRTTSPSSGWTSDQPYLHSSSPTRAISIPTTASTTARPELSALREFSPSDPNQRSCYSFPFALGHKLLLRLSFMYGDYDGLREPPRFGVRVDNSSLVQVATVADDVVEVEMVYTMMEEYTTVCFVKTVFGHEPFVNAVEIRVLTDGVRVYNDGSFYSSLLVLLGRYAFGANHTIGYGDDKYDRKWTPIPDNNRDYKSTIFNTTVANITVNSTQIPEEPPAKAFLTAITPLNSDPQAPLVFTLPRLGRQSPLGVYFIAYFSDAPSPSASKTMVRSFDMFVNGHRLNNLPIMPTSTHVVKFPAFGLDVTETIVFRLESTPNATLPPVISAMEVFTVMELEAVSSNGGGCLPDHHSKMLIFFAVFATVNVFLVGMIYA